MSSRNCGIFSRPEKYESTILGEGIVDAKKVVDMAAKIGGTTCYINYPPAEA